uniref:F-box/LRR-repeat protein At3g58900-like n=1 Tax=Fragaria vesca subsp. vesca TaxID=101020 RepID=UPI0005CAD8C4|nr:PREDICTED: F-box/LRR-repeat protein At3g58900-like [Fragaria vesca subsp. vesca]
MGSSSKHSKRCAEDRLSQLPDAILCHILSFLSTVEAVKTCVLSHRWENVWGAVPTIDISDHDRDGKESDFDSFSVFIDRVLSTHESVKVHLFRLGCFSMVDPLRFDYWVRTAIGCNVVQLDLGIFPPQSFELPGTLFTLKITFASSHLMENFFSCCPVLEELIFDAWEYDGDSDFNINISAPKLKILQIRLFQKLYDHGHKLFINAYAPNLEKFTFKGHLLVIYTLSNAKSLNEAKIDCNTLHAGQELDYHLADHLHRLLKGLLNVTHLSVTAPIFGDPHIVHQYPLPTFVNLMNLELHLQACCSWQSFFSFLNASPNLISLVLEKSHDCLRLHYLDEVYHEWNPPECVPACLVSRLKLICIMDYRGTPDQMKMAEYLLKHGEVLSKEHCNLAI